MCFNAFVSMLLFYHFCGQLYYWIILIVKLLLLECWFAKSPDQLGLRATLNYRHKISSCNNLFDILYCYVHAYILFVQYM